MKNKTIKAGYESIRLSFSEKSIYEKAMMFFFLPLLLFAAYMIFGLISHTFMDALIPNEYRESANVLMTMEFLKGNNPYALSALSGEYPPMIYLYGPLYSIVAAFIGGLLGFAGITYDIVLLHYGLTLFCILSSAVLSFLMIKEKTGSLTLSITAFIFLINCSWRYNYVNAVPDSMGLTIMMLVLFFLSKEKIKGREILCALFTAAVFFTKQYYLLIAGTVTIYLFIFKGFKSTVKYLVSLFAFFAAAVSFLMIKCPLFFTYTLYLAKGPGKGIASTVTRGTVKMTGAQYNMSQIMSLGGIFFMFFLTETIGVIFLLIHLIKERKPVSFPVGKSYEKFSFDILMLIHLFVSGVCLMYLGRNDGAFLSYYLELFMPALIMGGLSLFHRIEQSLKGKGAKAILIIYFVILISFTAFRSVQRLPLSPLSDDDRKQWEMAENVLNENPGDMYLYPLLAYYGIRNDIYVYNTGQPFVVSDRFYKSYHKHPELMERYPYAEDIFTSHFDYRKEILGRVKRGDYSVVSYIEGTDEVFTREDLAENYEKAGSFDLRTGRQVWETELYIRRE